MPYCHYTLATNIGADLVNGHDFEYVNMDHYRVLGARADGDTDTIGTQFGQRLFKKLIQASFIDVHETESQGTPSANIILGETIILDPKREEWSLESENMRLLEKYASRETVDRAHRLIGTERFRNEISRKIHGALLLRNEVDELKGNMALTAYSGAAMAIRCADGNPRHLIRIFNSLLMCIPPEYKWLFVMKGIRKKSLISSADQNRAMRSLSAITLNQVRSFPDIGPELHSFLYMLGEYMQFNFYKRPLTTDQVSSVHIDNTISHNDWKLIRVAVGHGLLYPNVGSGNPDEMPWRSGIFHLAYSLAPNFLLLPRRGKAVKLSTIKKFYSLPQNEREALIKNGNNQLSMFDEGDET